MTPYFRLLNALIAQIEKEYKEYQGQIKWVDYYYQAEAESRKDSLLKQMDYKVLWSFQNTKPYLNHLSKGCSICGQGLWSCLFITNQCNASCFYCPAKQDYDALPGTQNLDFNSSEDYVDYLLKFGFKGASISGGEPLLYFDRTLEYVKKIRQNLPDDFYIWLYTNGILADELKLKLLADAGLNEIRFDIGATAYKLDNVRKAKGVIPVVSIEIPAVPEKVELLKELLPKMIDAGVSNLHFHQLRLTKHNAPKLLAHKYTFLHGEKAVVLESELAALEIMLFAAQNNIPIGINYCNFQYKNRFQSAGFRKMLAELYRQNNEEITENGYLRSIFVDMHDMSRSISGDELKMNRNLYSSVELSYRAVKLKKMIYSSSRALPEHESAIKLGNLILEANEIDEFLAIVDQKNISIPDDEKLFAIWQMESIEREWRQYF